MAIDHDHDHDHADAHEPVNESRHIHDESIRIERALRELLIAKGVFTAGELQQRIAATESRTPEAGARVVARAWVDPQFKAWLLKDAKPAIEHVLSIDLKLTPELVVVENTAERHHVICCTLCSCYPRAVLGVPPAWYKSPQYRSRVVIEPRAVLAEFGTEIADGVEIQVVDSTADMRYMVLPLRPSGTEHLGEAQLATIVTRDAMIGVTVLPEVRL